MKFLPEVCLGPPQMPFNFGGDPDPDPAQDASKGYHQIFYVIFRPT